jgi:hypothetical protein
VNKLLAVATTAVIGWGAATGAVAAFIFDIDHAGKAGVIGVQGLAGATGKVGAAGSTGPIGERGISGDTGQVGRSRPTYVPQVPVYSSGLTGCVIGDGGVRLRSGPGVNNSTIVIIPVGAQVRWANSSEVGPSTRDGDILWDYVYYSGYYGWVITQFVDYSIC